MRIGLQIRLISKEFGKPLTNLRSWFSKPVWHMADQHDVYLFDNGPKHILCSSVGRALDSESIWRRFDSYQSNQSSGKRLLGIARARGSTPHKFPYLYKSKPEVHGLAELKCMDQVILRDVLMFSKTQIRSP